MSLVLWLFCVVVVGLAFALVRTRVKAARLSRLGWNDLITRLKPLPMDEISLIAEDYLHPRNEQFSLDLTRLSPMVREVDGFRRMYANAEVLIALADYAQRWNRRESLIVAERMRRDGVTLRRAVFRLSLGAAFGYDKVHGPFWIQEAASSYCLMRARVLALYETSHAGRFPLLASVL